MEIKKGRLLNAGRCKNWRHDHHDRTVDERFRAVGRKSKRKLIMNAFITSQFGYCPLVWMFHSREMNNRINRIHERSLRIVYKNKQSTFQELLDRDKSVSVHHSNIRKLAIEIFKVKNNLSPEILNDVF